MYIIIQIKISINLFRENINETFPEELNLQNIIDKV